MPRLFLSSGPCGLRPGGSHSNTADQTDRSTQGKHPFAAALCYIRICCGHVPQSLWWGTACTPPSPSAAVRVLRKATTPNSQQRCKGCTLASRHCVSRHDAASYITHWAAAHRQRVHGRIMAASHTRAAWYMACGCVHVGEETTGSGASQAASWRAQVQDLVCASRGCIQSACLGLAAASLAAPPSLECNVARGGARQ